jgi:3-hydroxypropanoate dehydrogenase
MQKIVNPPLPRGHGTEGVDQRQASVVASIARTDLVPADAGGNRAAAPGPVARKRGKTMKAPVTAILAYDGCFYEKPPKLFPHHPSVRDRFAKSPELAETTAFRNATLQGGSFILAARALGLDCGPMSGFDNAKVDAEFFTAAPYPDEATTEIPASCRVESKFLSDLGCGNPAALHPRSARLHFDEACRLL